VCDFRGRGPLGPFPLAVLALSAVVTASQGRTDDRCTVSSLSNDPGRFTPRGLLEAARLRVQLQDLEAGTKEEIATLDMEIETLKVRRVGLVWG
jgi:hypothetical protein